MAITTQEIVDYVMDSPSNTNPAVLRSLLSEHTINLDFRELIIINNRTKTATSGAVSIDDYYLENGELRSHSVTIRPNETVTIHLPIAYSDILHDRTGYHFILRIAKFDVGFNIEQDSDYVKVRGETGVIMNMRHFVCFINKDAPQGYTITITDASTPEG